jgi:hypothetical protein
VLVVFLPPFLRHMIAKFRKLCNDLTSLKPYSTNVIFTQNHKSIIEIDMQFGIVKRKTVNAEFFRKIVRHVFQNI